MFSVGIFQNKDSDKWNLYLFQSQKLAVENKEYKQSPHLIVVSESLSNENTEGEKWYSNPLLVWESPSTNNEGGRMVFKYLNFM